MTHIMKRTILVLFALSLITAVTIFTFSHRGAPQARAVTGTTLGVYFGSDNDAFYALDGPHGYQLWSYQYQSGGNTWSPAIARNGNIYFEVSNSSSTAVEALNIVSGSLVWSFTFPAGTSGKNAIAISNSVVSFAVNASGSAGSIYGLNARTGKQIWAHPAASNASFGNPVTVNGVLYAAEQPLTTGNTPQLDALNITNGSVIWTQTIPSVAATNLTVANGVIYYGGNSSLYAVNATTGSVIWNSQVDGGPFSTPTIGNNLIYYVSKTNYVTAVNASDGSLAWHYLVGKPFAPSVSPALYQSGVYIGALNKNVYALQATTGTLIWQHGIGVPITTTASIANGIIHVGLQKGSLRTLNVSNGLERWYFHTNGVIETSSPPLLAYFQAA